MSPIYKTRLRVHNKPSAIGQALLQLIKEQIISQNFSNNQHGVDEYSDDIHDCDEYEEDIAEFTVFALKRPRHGVATTFSIMCDTYIRIYARIYGVEDYIIKSDININDPDSLTQYRFAISNLLSDAKKITHQQ